MAFALKSLALDAGKQVLQAKVSGKASGKGSGDPLDLGRTAIAALTAGKSALQSGRGADDHGEPALLKNTAAAAFSAGKAALRDKDSGEPTALGRGANAAFGMGARALQSKMGDKAIPLAALSRSATAQSFLSVGKSAARDYDSPAQPSSFRHAASKALASHATGLGKSAGRKWLESYIAIPRAIGRIIQAIACGVACGIYLPLMKAGAQPEWLFASFIAAVSVVIATLFALSIPMAACWSSLRSYRLWPVDMILGLLWLIMFGLFATIFVKRTEEEGDYKGASTKTMKAAVWLDLACALFWLASGAFGGLRRKASRKADALGQDMLTKTFSRSNTYSSSEEVWGKA